jgi:hypothetical protein
VNAAKQALVEARQLRGEPEKAYAMLAKALRAVEQHSYRTNRYDSHMAHTVRADLDRVAKDLEKVLTSLEKQSAKDQRRTKSTPATKSESSATKQGGSADHVGGRRQKAEARDTGPSTVSATKPGGSAGQPKIAEPVQRVVSPPTTASGTERGPLDMKGGEWLMELSKRSYERAHAKDAKAAKPVEPVKPAPVKLAPQPPEAKKSEKRAANLKEPISQSPVDTSTTVALTVTVPTPSGVDQLVIKPSDASALNATVQRVMERLRQPPHKLEFTVTDSTGTSPMVMTLADPNDPAELQALEQFLRQALQGQMNDMLQQPKMPPVTPPDQATKDDPAKRRAEDQAARAKKLNEAHEVITEAAEALSQGRLARIAKKPDDARKHFTAVLDLLGPYAEEKRFDKGRPVWNNLFNRSIDSKKVGDWPTAREMVRLLESARRELAKLEPRTFRSVDPRHAAERMQDLWKTVSDTEHENERFCRTRFGTGGNRAGESARREDSLAGWA